MPDYALMFTLEHKRRELLEACFGLSDNELRVRPTPEEWSILEVLAHLPAADRYYLDQAYLVLADTQHMFAYFDDTEWKQNHPHINDGLVSDCLEDVANAHEEVLRVLSSLSEEDLLKTARHPRRGHINVRGLFERYLAHDENHIQQIRAIRAAIVRR